MKFQYVFALLAVFVTISFCTGHIGGGQIRSIQKWDPQVYCGRTLARALALVCFDEGKRSDTRNELALFDLFSLPYYKSQESQEDWMLSPYKSRGVGFSSRGKRYPGVVNECCDKPCSINELMTYC